MPPSYIANLLTLLAELLHLITEDIKDIYTLFNLSITCRTLYHFLYRVISLSVRAAFKFNHTIWTEPGPPTGSRLTRTAHLHFHQFRVNGDRTIFNDRHNHNTRSSSIPPAEPPLFNDCHISCISTDCPPLYQLTLIALFDPAVVEALFWARTNPLQASLVRNATLFIGVSWLDHVSSLRPARDDQSLTIDTLQRMGWTVAQLVDYRSHSQWIETTLSQPPELNYDSHMWSQYAGYRPPYVSPNVRNPEGAGKLPFHVSNPLALLLEDTLPNLRRLRLVPCQALRCVGPALSIVLCNPANLPNLESIEVQGQWPLLFELLCLRPKLREVTFSTQNTSSTVSVLSLAWSSRPEWASGRECTSAITRLRLSYQFVQVGDQSALLGVLSLLPKTLTLLSLTETTMWMPSVATEQETMSFVQQMVAQFSGCRMLKELTVSPSSAMADTLLLRDGRSISPESMPESIRLFGSAGMFAGLRKLSVPMWMLLGRFCLAEDQYAPALAQQVVNMLPSGLEMLKLRWWVVRRYTPSEGMEKRHAEVLLALLQGLVEGKERGLLTELTEVRFLRSTGTEQWIWPDVSFDKVRGRGAQAGLLFPVIEVEPQVICGHSFAASRDSGRRGTLGRI